MTRRDWLTALAGVTPGLRLAARGGWAPAPELGTAARRADPTTLSIAELGTAMAGGELTPLDVTMAYLARIAERDPQLGAFITVTRDRAVADARRVMTDMSRHAAAPRRTMGRGSSSSAAGGWPGGWPGDGAGAGALAGVPIAHKDLFATRGILTTGGSRLYDRWIPDHDADLVARLAQAGTVLVGKTNTHELGGGVTTINPFFGTTHNPHDQARIAGGSSGGSAVAVAARLALVATGSDTGGSVRIPAALCGCVGFKPTFGLLLTAGVLGACPTFDHAGLITRSTEDAALALAAIVRRGDGAGTAGDSSSRADRRESPRATLLATYRAAVTRGVAGLRVGVARPYFFAGLEPGVRAAVEGAIEGLRAAGAVVRDTPVDVDDRRYDDMFAPIAVSEIRATYARAWRTSPSAFSPDFAAVFAGPGPTAAAVATARIARAAFQRSLEGVLAQVDVLVMPTVPLVAPAITGPIDGMRILRNTWPFNAARLPAVTVPCGTGDAGLPVGLQLIGRRGDDARLLAIAGAVTRL